jgi:hypothetical protein
MTEQPFSIRPSIRRGRKVTTSTSTSKHNRQRTLETNPDIPNLTANQQWHALHLPESLALSYSASPSSSSPSCTGLTRLLWLNGSGDDLLAADAEAQVAVPTLETAPDRTLTAPDPMVVLVDLLDQVDGVVLASASLSTVSYPPSLLAVSLPPTRPRSTPASPTMRRWPATYPRTLSRTPSALRPATLLCVPTTPLSRRPVGPRSLWP